MSGVPLCPRSAIGEHCFFCPEPAPPSAWNRLTMASSRVNRILRQSVLLREQRPLHGEPRREIDGPSLQPLLGTVTHLAFRFRNLFA